MSGPEDCRCGHPRCLHTNDHDCRRHTSGTKCSCTEWRAKGER